MIYWQIFWLFTRVAFLSWGGGPASLALMQRETVTAGWVTSEEFADSVAVGNSLPGPIAPQVSAFVGYKLAGFWGAVAGAVGTVVPTTLLMLLAITAGDHLLLPDQGLAHAEIHASGRAPGSGRLFAVDGL